MATGQTATSEALSEDKSERESLSQQRAESIMLLSERCLQKLIVATNLTSTAASFQIF